MVRRLIIISLFLVLATCHALAEEVSPLDAHFNAETAQQIETLLSQRDPMATARLGVSRFLAHGQIATLYQQRHFQPLWLHGWQLHPAAGILMAHLRDAGLHGLCGNEYLLAELEGLIHIHEDFSRHSLPLAPENRAVLDLFLSQAFLTFATHMVEGQVDPALTHVDWRARRRKADLVKLLEYALDSGRMESVLRGLLPPHEGYHALQDALRAYQTISAVGGWPEVPAGPTIRPGHLHPRVALLKAVLHKTGDLKEPGVIPEEYDEYAVAAVIRFQKRHGLVSDGLVGRKTIAALNVSVDERIRQIELNLERWRWMPRSFGQRHIRVNVADFRLDVIEAGELQLSMPVIVGTQYRKTPVFSATMTYLEFAPYWTVPPTILREDKLPLIKRSPDYFAEKHFRILSREEEGEFVDPLSIDWASVRATTFPGLLRMEPGPWNPLGRVKFMFPNRFNVYLHDTNEMYLFENNVRSFSSGCIRVKRPRDLANYLLKDQLGIEDVDRLLAATEPEQVPIKALPVHIQYWTAWVDAEGEIHFRDDVYFRDMDLEVALTDPAYRVMEQLQVSSGSSLAHYD